MFCQLKSLLDFRYRVDCIYEHRVPSRNRYRKWKIAASPTAVTRSPWKESPRKRTFVVRYAPRPWPFRDTYTLYIRANPRNCESDCAKWVAPWRRLGSVLLSIVFPRGRGTDGPLSCKYRELAPEFAPVVHRRCALLSRREKDVVGDVIYVIARKIRRGREIGKRAISLLSPGFLLGNHLRSSVLFYNPICSLGWIRDCNARCCNNYSIHCKNFLLKLQAKCLKVTD